MRVTVKGQVTIPKWVRDRFGVKPGTNVRFREANKQIVLEKASGTASRMEQVYGILKRPQSSDAWIKKLRGQ